MASDGSVAHNLEKGETKRCARFRECNLKECIFYDGTDHCWSLVSPFKMRRRPSLLLKDTADRSMCLSMPCTECEYFEG